MEQQQRIEIGRRIRDLREASPQTNESIAEHVGVGVRSVANWVSGATGITYKNAKAVAALFEVDVRWLWDGVERTSTPDLLGGLSAAEPETLEQKLDQILDQQAALLADVSLVRSEQERLMQHQGLDAHDSAEKRK